MNNHLQFAAAAAPGQPVFVSLGEGRPVSALPAPSVHALFRVRVVLRSGVVYSHTRLHDSGCEAVLQALADHPDARSVSAIFVARLA